MKIEIMITFECLLLRLGNINSQVLVDHILESLHKILKINRESKYSKRKKSKCHMLFKNLSSNKLLAIFHYLNHLCMDYIILMLL